MTNNDSKPIFRYIVRDGVSGRQVENPYATSPLEPTSYTTAQRLWQGIRHYQGTDYYIEEVPTAETKAAWRAGRGGAE